DLLLLDEPTTFLDVAHQIEVIELVQRLNADGKTVVMVLHDINEASRASDHIVAMKDGRILHEGPPADVVRPDHLRELYGVECDVFPHPTQGHPVCIPVSAPLDDQVAPGGAPDGPGRSRDSDAGIQVRGL